MWKKTGLLGLMSLLLLSCASAPDFSGRIVRQGNLLPKVKLQHLKMGMTKEEVKQVMGDSLLSYPFNQDRWDYVDARRKGNSDMKIKYVSLYFQKGRLSRIEKSQ